MSRKPIKFDEDGLPIPVKEQQTVSFDSDGLPIPIKKKYLRSVLEKLIQVQNWIQKPLLLERYRK